MKTTLLIVLSLLLIIGCSDPIDLDTLVKRGGVFYEVNSDVPYSGDVISYYSSNGKKRLETKLIGGKPNGTIRKWYDNGQKMKQSIWKDGSVHGKFISWYENGQKEGEGEMKDGVFLGIHTKWYENGQKQEEMETRHGKLIYIKKWTKDGELYEDILF